MQTDTKMSVMLCGSFCHMTSQLLKTSLLTPPDSRIMDICLADMSPAWVHWQDKTCPAGTFLFIFEDNSVIVCLNSHYCCSYCWLLIEKVSTVVHFSSAYIRRFSKRYSSGGVSELVFNNWLVTWQNELHSMTDVLVSVCICPTSGGVSGKSNII